MLLAHPPPSSDEHPGARADWEGLLRWPAALSSYHEFFLLFAEGGYALPSSLARAILGLRIV